MLLTAMAAQAQINISGKVFGGARHANVGGHTFVTIKPEKHDVIINAVYGGNDIAGTIGSSSEPAGVDTDDHYVLDNYNAFVRTDKDDKEAEVDGKHLFIGQLFGGGYGNYTYSGENGDPNIPKTNKKYDVTLTYSVWDPTLNNGAGGYNHQHQATLTDIDKPELARTYVDLHGGTFGYVYGGGDNVTVTENTQICINNTSTVRTTSIKDKVMKDGSSNPLELLTTERLQEMGINTEYFNKIENHIAGVDKFLFSRVFGGNNKADMRIMPSWHLQAGSIENLYSGGNEGRMTSPNGLLLNIGSATETSQINIYNVYGGCRKADVCPENSDGTPVTHVFNLDGYKFPAELAARTLVRGGQIHNVYGGNDVRGRVYFGNAVGIYTSISGDVYGGGNGSYPYTDNSDLANDLIYGDFYYNPVKELNLTLPEGETFTELHSAQALNKIRPNAEQVSIRIAGEANADKSMKKEVIIGGSVYCGGNSATLQMDPSHATISNDYPLVELKIGSYIKVDKVFLGNNGANMVANTNDDDVLQVMKSTDKTSDDTKFNSITLTNKDLFAEYMKGCAMNIIPSINFDDVEVNHDPADYIDYTAYVGSLYCGGNVGSMTYNDVEPMTFNRKLVIFDKLVGGCNNAIVPEKENVNAFYEGGLIGTPNGTSGNKVELTLNGLKIEPKRWIVDNNGQKTGLEWNTIYASTGAETDAIPTDVLSTPITSSSQDLDRRFKGGHVYGGCYSSGIVNGNVVINIDANTVDRDKLFDVVKTDKLGEEESLYGDDQTVQATFTITKRNTGVLLPQQGMDVLGAALNVFGGGKGKSTEIWGSTTINLNRGYTFQVFGGSEEGVIGKRIESNGVIVTTDESDATYTKADGIYHFNGRQFKYDSKYSCYVNLCGAYAGVSKQDKNDEEMAEAEFMYGGGFFGPICGNTIINLGKGRIFNSFAGSCNADILGHTETYIGRQVKNGPEGNKYKYKNAFAKNVNNPDYYEEGFPWVRDYTYGGNDLGGLIMQAVDFSGKVRETGEGEGAFNVRGKVHKNNSSNVLTANAYTEYLQGRAEGIFAGCYGTYDYTDPKFKEYFYTWATKNADGTVATYSEGADADNLGTAKTGYSKPYIENAIVNFRPTYTQVNNKVNKIYGAGQGYPSERDRDNMQDRSYVLIDVPQGMEYYKEMEVFGAGAWSGVGMRTFMDPSTTDTATLDGHSTIIDLVRGQIGAAYGGSYAEGITRRTVLNVPVGSTIFMGSIFGGAFGTKTLPPCDVYESHVEYHSADATLVYDPNTSELYQGAIYGGNNSERRTLYTHVNVDVPVVQKKVIQYDGEIEGMSLGEEMSSNATIYGAGRGANTWSEYTEVNLADGAQVWEVYGGGQMGHVLNAESVQAYMSLYKDSRPADIPASDVSGTWAEAWKNAWTLGSYYTPGADENDEDEDEITDEYLYTDYVGNTATNSTNVKARTELDAKTAALLGDGSGKFNTHVIINEGATVKNYAYGGGLGVANIDNSGDVWGTTYIALLGGTVRKDLYAAGTRGGVYNAFGAEGFTASANAYIQGGTARNVYGGGWKGSVGKHKKIVTKNGVSVEVDANIDDSPANDILGETHVVIGDVDGTDFIHGIPAIERNAYGGGEGGAVFGTTNITMNNGFIGYRYFASEPTDKTFEYIKNKVITGEGENDYRYDYYQEKIDDETRNDGLLGTLDKSGCIFGGGYIDNSSVDFTNVTMYGGHVRNSLFGGGEIAAIGRGVIHADGEDNSIRTLQGIYRPGKTKLNLFSGHVHRNVFGGGRGYNNLNEGGTLYSDGFVFGQTEVHVHGGEVGTKEGVAQEYGNVFGGGDIGYVYSAYEMTDGTFRKGVQNGHRYDGIDDSEGYYYEHDWADSGNFILYNNNTEKKLTEDCKVLIEPQCKVTAAGGITLTNIVYPKETAIPSTDLNYLKAHNVTTGYDANGVVTAEDGITIDERTYAKGEYVPVNALNTLGNKNTSASQWAKLDLFGIIIHNAVFAGGNTSTGSSKAYANATSVYGNATASIHDIYHRDLITLGTGHVGGLYGDGNLTFVDGYRGLNITNYGTDYYTIASNPEISIEDYYNNDILTDRERDYYQLTYICEHDCTDDEGTAYHPKGVNYSKASTLTSDQILTLFKNKTNTDVFNADGSINSHYWKENGVCTIYAGRLMNSIQRADFCGVFGSRMVMQGAQDRVPEVVDFTNYTINRVREVSLNKKISTAGDAVGSEGYLHGNYFGIYNIVNFLGALTSDVNFGDGGTTPSAQSDVGRGDVRTTDNTDNRYNPDYTGQTFYGWKKNHKDDRIRNNGNSHNKVALASGVYLELTSEKGTGTDLYEKDWGLITGVVELDLINVQTGLGGGFVYARNEHGVRSRTNVINTTLTALNRGAVTQRDFSYDTTESTKKEWQTSGNFVHSTQTIIDDCYNISGKYNSGYNKPDGVPAHYWYIKGQVYVYDQYISAYTGAPNAYSETVDIPLTITAASHGTMRLLNVMPNKYAYKNTNGDKLGTTQKLVINDKEYNLNDPISYWDWYLLTAAEKSLFVDKTYVTIDSCKIGDNYYPEGYVMLPSEYQSLSEAAATNPQVVETGQSAVPAVIKATLGPGGSFVEVKDDKNQPVYEAFDFVFRESNNLSHNTGYILTYKVNNPVEWNTWYTEYKDNANISDRPSEKGEKNESGIIQYIEETNSGSVIRTIADEYDASHKKIGPNDGPTYYLDNQSGGGLLGQRPYDVGNVIPETVYDTYQDVKRYHLGAIPTSGQAEFEPAYIVTKDIMNVQKLSDTDPTNLYEDAIVAKSDYTTGENWPTAMAGSVERAYYCTSTIKLGENKYIYLGSRMSATQKSKFITDYPALAEEIENNVVPAYCCTEEGLYGGNYYESGVNYRALEVFSSMSKTDRDNFSFNYDALDLLIDSDYSRPEGQKYQYDGPVEDTNNDEVIDDADVTNMAGYSITRNVDYTATYNGTSSTTEDPKVYNGVTLINGTEYSRVDYEKLPNEKRHYAAIDVTAAGTVYVVNSPIQIGNTPYAVGSTISSSAFNSLGDSDKLRITRFTFDSNDVGKKYYYCRENYTVDHNTEGEAVTNVKTGKKGPDGEGEVTVSFKSGAYGDGEEVPVGLLIDSDNYGHLTNRQTNFTIHGIAPIETSTLFVSRESDIFDLSTEKIITVIYQYDYEESDQSGNITPVSERHVLNIHINFKSGVPSVEDIKAPSIVIPGTKVGLRDPNVTPGAYEVTGGGWELYEKIGDAESHTNGVEFKPQYDPLYWYQDGYYVAYYAMTYLGKTYSNHVPVSVANYHDLKKVMDAKEHHYYVDNPNVKRDSKIYINDYKQVDEQGNETAESANGLDLLKQLFDLSVLDIDPDDDQDEDGLINHGDFTGHKPLNDHVKAGQNLEFFLRTDIDHSGPWTPIGNDNTTDNPATTNVVEGECFQGTLHGDGHTITGLDKSLFAHLCGNVYNLGVTGSFTSAGVADEGYGYVENCWVKTEATALPSGATAVEAVFGNPMDNEGTQIENCYYPESNKALDVDRTTTTHSRGSARRMPDKTFYNGSVAYDLNGFYLHKRYYDGVSLNTGKYYKYLIPNADGTLPEGMSTGYYPSTYAHYPLDAATADKLRGYVEERYADGDFRYAIGIIPEEAERRMRVVTETEDGKDVEKVYFAPIWPNDYLFFGQSLGYGYFTDHAHQNEPSSYAISNRVYRAPAYFRSGEMDVAHFNADAVFAAKEKLTAAQIAADVSAREAYPGMTAIDFTGHNDVTDVYGTGNNARTYKEGWSSWAEYSYKTGESVDEYAFFPPLLDVSEGLTRFRNADLTRNLLVYTGTPDGTNPNQTQVIAAAQNTETVVSEYLSDWAYQEIETAPANSYSSDTYRYHTVERVDNASDAMRGHWVKKLGTDSYTATRDHFLKDKQDFNAPMAYTFQSGKRMWYQREPVYDDEHPETNEYVDLKKGWSAVSLPFSAEIVTTDTKGEITHFYNGSYDVFIGDKPKKNNDNSKVGHEYWLREFTGVTTEGDPSITTASFNYPVVKDDGSDILEEPKEVTNTFLWDYYYKGVSHNQKDANSDLYQEYKDDQSFHQYYSQSRTYNNYPMLSRALPYIIGFPGATYYEFDLSGQFVAGTTIKENPGRIGKQTITFASQKGTTIRVSDDEIANVVENISTISGYTFKPSYLNMSFDAGTDHYTLKPDNGSGVSSFDKVPTTGAATLVDAFRPYFVKVAAQSNPTRTIIFGNDQQEEQKGVEEHGDPKKEELNGGLRIWTKKGKIFVESSLKFTEDMRVVTPAGITVATFTVKPGQTVEVQADFSGMYIVHTLDGLYTKKVTVRK